MADPFTLLRSDNRDVERAQLNKILRRQADLAAQQRDRATHTGSQATSTITGLDAALDDRVRGTVRISVGTTAPVSPSLNDLWVDTN